MPIKTTRHHCSPSRMVRIKKFDNRCWQGCREIKTFITAGGNIKMTASSESSLTVPKKVKIELPFDPAIAFRYMPKRCENICPHKNWNMNVHNRIIHNSQKAEKPNVYQLING